MNVADRGANTDTRLVRRPQTITHCVRESPATKKPLTLKCIELQNTSGRQRGHYGHSLV